MEDKYPCVQLFRQLYVLRKLTDEWGDKNISILYHPHFNMAFMPFFMAVGLHGNSSSAIASDLKVSRQAAGKIMKELEAVGLVRGEKNSKDARSIMLYLTEAGREFYLTVTQQSALLQKKYIKLVGKKPFENLTSTLGKLINLHETLNKHTGNA